MNCLTTRKPFYVGLNMECNQLEGFDPGNADQNVSDYPFSAQHRLRHCNQRGPKDWTAPGYSTVTRFIRDDNNGNLLRCHLSDKQWRQGNNHKASGNAQALVYRHGSYSIGEGQRTVSLSRYPLYSKGPDNRNTAHQNKSS